jgi:hypothetical protein
MAGQTNVKMSGSCPGDVRVFFRAAGQERQNPGVLMSCPGYFLHLNTFLAIAGNPLNVRLVSG